MSRHDFVVFSMSIPYGKFVLSVIFTVHQSDLSLEQEISLNDLCDEVEHGKD